MNGKQLKNSILQLAIQGKLVPQDPNDEPASVLLQRIRKEKKQLVKLGKLKKKDLESEPISDEEKPFEIPEKWQWLKLKDFVNLYTGNSISETEKLSKFVHVEGMDYIGTKDVGFNHTISYSNGVNIPDEYAVDFRKALDNSILMCIEGGSAGRKIAILSKEVCFGNKLCCFIPYCVIPKYLYYYLQSPAFFEIFSNNKTGIIGGVSINSLKELVVPIPSLSEQHRIVAKIEELMPLVEEYDKAQTKLDDLNAKLPEAIKKSILQEAIMGKLVAQDPNDEPASVLLQRIRKEKEQLVKDGKLKKKDLVSEPITDEDKPFEIPEGWEWCRLNDLGIFERGNGIKRDETLSTGLPCIRYGEMYTKYRYAPTFNKTISFTTKEVFDKCRKAHNGDLFMALTGENKQDIALCAQYVGNEEIAVGGDLCHFTVLQAYGLYLVYLINSPYYSSKKELLATGDIIVHISADKLGSIAIPLPPLSEQHRIVAKIEELFNILK